MTEPLTFPEAFQRTVSVKPDAISLHTVDDSPDLTWRAYGEAVRRIAGGLAALGVHRGQTVATMLTNRPEFHLSETAASHLGATTFSIYNTSSPEQIGYLLGHAGTRVVICERQFADRIRAAGGPVEHLLIVEDGDLDRLEPSPGFDFEASWRSVRPDDVLCLIYTSGTTGPPKGVEHTHRGVLALAKSFSSPFPLGDDDMGISYLPAAHVADRFLNHYFAMRYGVAVTPVADLRQLPAALAAARPTTFAGVPRIWEKIKLGLEMRLQADPGLAAGFQAGEPQVLAAVRAQLGLDKLRWALSGAAAIPPDVYAFLERLGLPVSEAWGMSECGLGIGAPPAQARAGTVGTPLPGLETRLTEDGELLARGPFLMKGYRDDPARTAEAIDPEGWLHTGDIVTVADDGHITIIDRKKELIINAGGKNMSPTNIENAIGSGSPLIGPMMVIGDNKPYNVALITLDPDVAAAFGEKLGLEPDPGVLVKDERIRLAVQDAVDAGNAKLSRAEQIKQFALLPAFWEPGGDEITPTMKVRRKPITQKYASEIAELYTRRADG
ncbi:long-chain fatty acid--CoA ligase [Amycolatopsis sp. WAC 04182]|uniref:AMP-binding protein n=1 Tax=Amycolatopsis sp. WAC 04182 TaxID=2203198 RepID=UPI000F766099|nr:AMP-binding protein [Amycolatopsis sp. WAC 04182]RSN55054.1 long-chain fatty acid--CoA ligase [Amycolatopsis sp. WAC 04182]